MLPLNNEFESCGCQKLTEHILVTWPGTNLLILRKWFGFEKNKSLLFCLRYDPLIVFQRQNHVTFIFLKTMSHDLLVQMAYRKYFLQSFHNGCLLLNKREQVTHYGTTNQKFANACGRRNKQKGVLDRRPLFLSPQSPSLFPFLPAHPPSPRLPFDVHQAG